MMLLVAAVLIGAIIPIGKLLDDVTPERHDPSAVRYTRYKVRTVPRGTAWTFGLSWLFVFVGFVGLTSSFDTSLGIRIAAGCLGALSILVFPLCALGLALFTGSVVDIRTDGLLVAHRVRPTRFWPYAELDEAKIDSSTKSIEVRAGGKRVTVVDLDGASESVLQELEHGITNARLTNDPMSAAMDLDPRDLGLASLGLASYRFPAPTREQLWAVVERRNAPRRMRIVAARAIAETSAPGEKKRIRIAAATSPDTNFRRSLEVLADDQRAEDEPDASERTARAR